MATSKVILIAAIIGFGSIFIGDFVSSLPIPESSKFYVTTGVALAFVFTVLYLAEKNGTFR